jgi:LysR family transcriptional activator of nhaA
VFPVSRLGADDMGLLRGLRLLGSSEGVQEEIHAIVSAAGGTIRWCSR